MILLTVSALSQKDQDFYHEQKIIIKPSPSHTLIGILTKVQFYKPVILLTFIAKKWEVGFELPQGALDTTLDRFLNKN